jgi:hypothetical protein
MMQHGPDGKPMMQPGPDGHMPGGHMQDGKECNCPMMKRAEQAGAETPPASPETPPPAHSTPPHEE